MPVTSNPRSRRRVIYAPTPHPTSRHVAPRGSSETQSAHARSIKWRPYRNGKSKISPLPYSATNACAVSSWTSTALVTPILDGVTASGKTAIYVDAIEASLAAGRPALLLVPEIALATPIIDRLRAELPVRIAVLHSGPWGRGSGPTSGGGSGRARSTWWSGRGRAVLAPLADVGLIVVDEEHDGGVQEGPNAALPGARRGARARPAGRRGRVLGSATPTVESGRYAPRKGRDRRVPSCLVRVGRGVSSASSAVDMRAELAAGNRGLLSARLVAALGERSIARTVTGRSSCSTAAEPRRWSVCRDCGSVAGLSGLRRGRSSTTGPARRLRCHHCGRAGRRSRPAARRASRRGSATSAAARSASSGRCGSASPAARRPAGPGHRRAARAGRSGCSTRSPAGGLDVLVGTSLGAKGLDVPQVTLVGVVSADIALNLPDERAAERTYQLLAQAVGRAGRGDHRGVAIIQTYRPEHRAIGAVVEGRADDVLRGGAGAARAIRLAAVRAAGEAHRRRSRIGTPPRRMRSRWPTSSAGGR